MSKEKTVEKQNKNFLSGLFRQQIFIPIAALIILAVFNLIAVIQWEKLGPLTNASNILRKFTGYSSILFPFIVAGICIAMIVLLINSTYGRAFKAIREDEIAAEAMGINLMKHKMISFCTSSFFAATSSAFLTLSFSL